MFIFFFCVFGCYLTTSFQLVQQIVAVGWLFNDPSHGLRLRDHAPGQSAKQTNDCCNSSRTPSSNSRRYTYSRPHLAADTYLKRTIDKLRAHVRKVKEPAATLAEIMKTLIAK